MARPRLPAPKPIRLNPVVRLVVSMLLMAGIGAFIWLIYLGASGSFAPLGNCGPQGFIGYDGQYVGGRASTGLAATAIGIVLLLAASAGVWIEQKTGLIVLTFVSVYVASLLVLALVAPLIWGPRHCVLF